jgi:hypothetical protein
VWPLMIEPIAELKPDPRNPRTHSPRQIGQIARSIWMVEQNEFELSVPLERAKSKRTARSEAQYSLKRKQGGKAASTIFVKSLSDLISLSTFVNDHNVDHALADIVQCLLQPRPLHGSV